MISQLVACSALELAAMRCFGRARASFRALLCTCVAAFACVAPPTKVAEEIKLCTCSCCAESIIRVRAVHRSSERLIVHIAKRFALYIV